MTHHLRLPWKPDTKPLMLAPMQGLTNRGLRSLFIDNYAPDLVFTEYVRALPGNSKAISKADTGEITSDHSTIPTIVQLIGGNIDALTSAAITVQDLGANHLNLNLGCPFGRITGNVAGGNLLKDTSSLAQMLTSLRKCIQGSFSVKIRSGYNDPSQIFQLIELFESCGIDFLILHPRTVLQRYAGKADHGITAELVGSTSLPVIANGDIRTTEDGHRVLEQTKAAGLMIGRGAIGDPYLFKRIRGDHPPISPWDKRILEIQDYLHRLLQRYLEIFCGDKQVLYKLREALNQIQDPEFHDLGRKMKKANKLSSFIELLESLPANSQCE